MFNRPTRKATEALTGLDFSQLLKDPTSFALAHLAELGLGSQLTAIAFDPVQSLLAVGTERGRLFIFGGPSVCLKWDLGRPVSVKHLAFRSGKGFLCVVDAKDTLSVFDLSRIEKGKPVRDSSLSMRTVITCIETSPHHSHLLLGGRDGTVEVFDVERGCLSPTARIPNLWLAQEEILRRSGVQDAPSRRHIPVCTDIKSHPINLNLLLISYEGGVSLWNIAQKKVEQNWEFVIPPGAPGGGNDLEEQLFTERRLNVTCIAWRPDGLVFAAGHEEGCLSFAYCSDELPLAIRTIERADVNKTTEEDLFGWSAQGKIGERKPSGREPIFKLAWSSFPLESYYDMARAGWGGSGSQPTSPNVNEGTSRIEEKTHTGGGTVLTILGGLLPSDPSGIHLFDLPVYVAPASHLTTSTPGNIPPPLRQALKDSITPLQHNLYPTATPPEDFLLLPRESPFFNQSFDPTSIIITTGADRSLPVLAAPHADHSIECWTFPPTASRLPRELALPCSFSWAGRGTCTGLEIYKISNYSYRKLVHQFEKGVEKERVGLVGGRANGKDRSTDQRHKGNDAEGRILISMHVDLTIKFWDISEHLLGKHGEILEMEYPRAFGHLTLDLKDILWKEEQAGRKLEATRLLRERPWDLEIGKIDLALESLGLAVLLSTGDVVVTKFDYGGSFSSYSTSYGEEAESGLNETVNAALREMSIDDGFDQSSTRGPTSPTSGLRGHMPSLRRPSPSISRKNKSNSSAPTTNFNEDQDRIVNLSHLPIRQSHIDSFRPIVAFSLPSHSQSCLAMSDIGFLASSSGAALAIIDMRGPEILYFDAGESGGFLAGNSKGKGKVGRSDGSHITSLTWTISAIGEDHDRNPRLVVVHASGNTRVFELSAIGTAWHLSENPISFSHDSLANAFKTFVLDRNGNPALANPIQLQAAQAHQNNFTRSEDTKGAFTSIWITVSPTTVAAYFNINGPRTAIHEDNIGFEKAEVIMSTGCLVLVLVARNRSVTTLSLPELEVITKMTFEAAVHTNVGFLSVAQDGDLIQYLDPLTIRLHTIFDFSRASRLLTTEIHSQEILMPWAPTTITSVKSSVGSFFGGERVYSAAEIDTILGGSTLRPPPKVRTVLAPPLVQTPQSRETSGFFLWNRPPQKQQREEVYEDAGNTRDVVSRTTEALSERGETLTYLQERLGGMANDAAAFASDAKKMAQREAGKRAVMGGFSSLFKKLG